MPDPDPLRLVASGMTTDDVARSLGWSRRKAVGAITRAARAAADAALGAEESRAIELVHLDLLRKALMPAALRGDIGAARTCLRITQVRATLLGLDVDPVAPPAPGLPGEVSIVDELRARRASRRTHAAAESAGLD
jgi:hypothetical protein